MQTFKDIMFDLSNVEEEYSAHVQK